MNYKSCIKYFKDIGVVYKTNVNIAPLLSMRVGGVASIITYPSNLKEFCQVLHYLNSESYKYFVLGNGTNVYFGKNYDGVIISTKHLNKMECENDSIVAMCGVSLTECAVFACENSLTGVEFAYGIPGTVGGGVYMNANAFGSSVSDVVYESKIYDINDNSTYVIRNDEHGFSEKDSTFQEKNKIVLESRFKLQHGEKEHIKCKMDSYMKFRIESQPLDKHSAGSAFKRLNGHIPSKLIDEIGLKGYSINGAEISTKHAGFIINNGLATAEDINQLIAFIKRKINDTYQINIEEEIIYVE